MTHLAGADRCLEMPLFIDLPAGVTDSNEVVIAGWVASPLEGAGLVVSLDGRTLPSTWAERPDVRAAHPDMAFCKGFGATIDISDFEGPEFEIAVAYGEERLLRDLGLTKRLYNERLRERTLREAARFWCLEHILCPHCRNPAAAASDRGGRPVCGGCGATYRQFGGALDFLSDEMRFALTPAPETTSANPYDPAALALIAETVQKDGMVLDCGAGSRPARMRNVINLEITAYRSTDVLAAGERLPFKDECFDAILSLAVLEHVRDPFACAREMLRVIKPGGKIMCSVPFLQPEHNFPGHFYNMTQTGLQNLFGAKADLISAEVPPHGHPIFAVQWILRDYLAGLPEPERSKFAQMTIGEAAAQDPAHQLTKTYAQNLPPDSQRRIACLNTLVFQRLGLGTAVK